METLSAYELLALVYDDWQERYGVFANSVLQKLARVSAGNFGELESFVDFGCGTGTLVLALRQSFPRARLVGVDSSAKMLERARSKAGANDIEWKHVTIEDARVLPTCAVAGSFFNTLNHLPDETSLARAFEAIACALSSRGWFYFDANNRLGFESWWTGRQIYEGPGFRLETDSTFDAATRYAHKRIRVEHAGHTAETLVRERWFDEETIASLLSAHFEVCDFEPWRPRPEDPPGTTFWSARRRR